ncbi:MAG TPA: FAD-binding monooxygenase, partial [Sphingomonas sp.]|nr:FAD-binding monooxygenase [Sphingomonas sp.]
MRATARPSPSCPGAAAPAALRRIAVALARIPGYLTFSRLRAMRASRAGPSTHAPCGQEPGAGTARVTRARSEGQADDMQLYLNGFQGREPEIPRPPARRGASATARDLPRSVDVLIVGCGPAGLTLAAQLAAFPDISTCIVDQKPGPMKWGQADGVACRTMEMFNAFGFADGVLNEAHWVNETTFWTPDKAHPETVVRTGRIHDTEPGLSEFPHVLLSQARIHDFYLETMRNGPAQIEPAYGRRLIDLRIDPAVSAGRGAPDHPVTATFERLDPGHQGQVEVVKARYVAGCDGAHSTVRKLLGHEMRGDSANQFWGVMDILAVTDFPDIRLKVLIRSAEDGNLLIIPREGGYMVRLYIELEHLSRTGKISRNDVTLDQLLAAAQRIIHPYKLEAKEVPWWSVYEIGQRLCDKFDDVPEDEAGERLPCVFIAGDACHTHSPKAGLGMNVSMQDAFNLGWKLAAVLRGRSAPELLHSYSAERQAIAKELIDFDREWVSVLSAPVKVAPGDEGTDPATIQDYFVRHGRYTAGTATRYRPSALTGEATDQHLAKGFVIGMRFHSAPVIRLADAKPLQLGHTVTADGRWRLFAFSGAEDPTGSGSAIRALCDFLGSDASPVRRYTPAGQDIDSVIDVRAVFQQGHRDLAVERMPAFLLPRKGRLGLIDYEKMFCVDPANDIYDLRGVDRKRGCIVVVRPDQYIAHVLPLDAHEALSGFFGGFMTGEKVPARV